MNSQVDSSQQEPIWRSKAQAYWSLIRADRPIGIYLLLWPALWALWIAGQGQPSWWIVAIFIAGTALMRSAGCAINDYADRDFDGHVARTNQRPLAAGLIRPREAIWVFVVLSLLAFGLVLFLNTQTILHSFIAVALAAVYPFTKRYIQTPQIVLGLAFAWAVPMAFTALQEEIPLVAWLLLLATVIWAVIYDTMYAMVDREDDLKIGIKSTAILFGQHDRLIIGLLQLLMLGLLIAVGLLSGLGWVYYLGVAVGAGWFGYQQWLIKEREPAKCFRGFLNNHYFGLTLFLAIVLDYLIAS